VSIQYIPIGNTFNSSSYAISGSHAIRVNSNPSTALFAEYILNDTGPTGRAYLEIPASQITSVTSEGLTILVRAKSNTAFVMATSSFSVSPINNSADNPTLNLVRNRTYRFVVSGTPPTVAQSTFNITNNGSTDYVFSGGATGNDPTLTLIRGHRYEFNVATPSHPFWIQTSAGAYNAANVLTTTSGVYGNGTADGRIEFIVPTNAANTLYYVSQFSSNMAGTINVVSDNDKAFRIETTGGSAYNTGVTNNNIVAGTLTFKVPSDAPDSLRYASPGNALMVGTINITG